MKKMILLTTVLVGFTFAKTGMMTADGETGMGVWFNHGVWADGDNYEGQWSLGFDYMTGMGVEVGLNLHEDYNGIEIGYHHKLDDLGLNIEFQRTMWDIEGYTFDVDWIWLRTYCDSGFHAGLGGDGELGEEIWWFRWAQFGNIWTMGNGLNLGVTYTMVINDIGGGELSFDLGYTF